MNEQIHIGPAPRARPVADAPVEALLAGVDEIARRWILMLIAARPLEEVGAMPLDELARAAPELCAQLVRALASDAELRLIDPEPQAGTRGGGAQAARIGSLAVAREPRDMARDVEALRWVLWQAVLGELHDAPARLVGDLSDRLALACATALGAMLAQAAPAAAAPAPGARATGREQVLYSAPSAVPGRRGAILIDERTDTPTAAPPVAVPPIAVPGEKRRAAPATSDVQTAAAESASGPARERQGRTAPAKGRPLPWDIPLASGDAAGGPQGRTGASEPVLRISRAQAVVIDESL